ncbi:CaiB/BaiF CoA-transferase family protein [Halobacillus rhizosphaerae]|uniref:CaiB/BaiF CoA transferase family protein n=1 Tax=Halobacillus rhizosphaerae TaxID=3064889 RepID=UPI00398B1D77
MAALEGIKIIDLTRILSGPYCTMTLADLGAEVIKVESPKGDDTRQWGPPFVEEESTYFLSINRNKKSVVINLKEEDGKQIFFNMIKDADVVVENFRPGTLERLGIGYETLKKHNPGIILSSISGFGQTGPYAQKPGYDLLAQGLGGLMSVTGEKGGNPVKAGFSMADIGTGMWAAFGILVALIERDKSGKGQWIDASLLDTIVSWQTYLAGSYFATGKDPEPMGGAHPNIVPYQVFKASDGHFILAIGNDKLWEDAVEAMGVESLKSPQFKTNPQRVEHRDELLALMEEQFQLKSVKEWVKLFESYQIPCGPVNHLSDILNDPHIIDREMVVHKEHLGSQKMINLPLKFSRTPGEIRSYPPGLGEHSEEILESMGYSKEAIESLLANGVIASKEKVKG